jgi:hypothetical protein
MTKYNMVLCCHDKNLGKCGRICNSWLSVCDFPCLLCSTAMWWDWPGGAWLEWHGFLGLSDSSGVSQCVPSLLCMGSVGSWPGAGYYTNFSYLKYAKYIGENGPHRQSSEQGRTEILIMVFGIKFNLFTNHYHYVTWNISASWKFFYRSWFQRYTVTVWDAGTCLCLLCRHVHS